MTTMILLYLLNNTFTKSKTTASHYSPR